MPTLQLEGFGLVTIESMACGTPVLGTPVGGTPEILSGFKRDFIFADSFPEAMADGIQSGIEKYFLNDKEYELLRQNCRSYVEKKYSWKNHSANLFSIIENSTRCED